jgi:hypothetical protein
MTGSASRATVSTYATGLVRFSWVSSCSGYCPIFLRIPAGTTVATLAGVGYVTLAEAAFPGGSSGLIPIQAKLPGPSGNAPAGSVVFIPGAFGSLVVTNPKPITGGTSRQTRIIGKTDMESVVGALSNDLIARARASFELSAGASSYAVTAPPDLTLSSDHLVGEEVDSFTVTGAVTLYGTAFSDARARSLLVANLRSRVATGEELSALPAQTSYEITGTKADGSVEVSGDAVGYAIPSIATSMLRSRVARMSLDQARLELARLVPGAVVKIRTSPDQMPFLPMLAARITLYVEPSG